VLTISPILVGFVILTMRGHRHAFAQPPQHVPTRQEIAEAYRSKAGEGGGTFISALRWERSHIKEIRQLCGAFHA